MSVDDMIERIPTKLFMSVLSVFSFAESYYTSILDSWKRIVRVLNMVFRPDYYIFFEGSAAAHRFYDTQFWASGSATPELMYCASTKTFFPWIPRHGTHPKFDILGIKELYRPLSLLSLEIVDSNDKVFYDLTDFLETLRHVEVTGFSGPSLFHILSAWTLSSGIVPNLITHSVRFIDSDGESKTIRLFHMEDSFSLEGASEASSTSTAEAVPAAPVAAPAEPVATPAPAEPVTAEAAPTEPVTAEAAPAEPVTTPTPAEPVTAPAPAPAEDAPAV